MEKMPAMILAFLAVIIFTSIIIYDKIGPEIERQEDRVKIEMNL